MSFGGFKFGASTSAPTSQPSSTQPPSVPTFSLTGATPIATPSTSQPFSFGGASSTQPAGGPAPGTSLFGGAGAGAGTQLGQQGQVGPTPGQSATGGFFGGGMFGAQPSQPSTGTPGASTGGLFGGTSMATPATGGLFGGTPGRQGQTPAQPSGLFGQSASTPAPTSLFGQPSQAAPTPGSSLFGAPAQSSTGPGTGLFGAAPQQQQSALQASTAAGPSSGSGLNKTTKFAETPEQVQKTIEQLDGWIKQQKQAGEGSNVELVGRAIWQTSGDIKGATEEYAAIAQGITSLQAALGQLRSRFLSVEEDLRKVAEIWETFKSVDGRPGALRIAAHRDFPQEFFARMAQSMEERVKRYRRTITQLNRAINSMSSDQETPSPQAIAQTIQNHQNALIALAAQLEDLQLRMNDLRAVYATWGVLPGSRGGQDHASAVTDADKWLMLVSGRTTERGRAQ
ncbi:hypothetical protein EHS25_005172 [Saitozyma podzolica]|uniref:Nucleoporin Nup54 alpha-helical domain-containing protein n=1 Tax=Saitozyma podzolica TaxID=1890683 RepID=A0A427XYG8_9TREE|nr:hypothetical protein EHS25_005172 [Saitozyma podzolica]